MPANNVDWNETLTYFQADTTTPLYLTVDGLSGSPKLPLTMWLRRSPTGPVALMLTTSDFLSVLDAPNDNVLFVSVPEDVMRGLPAAVYCSDVVARRSPTSATPYGAFFVPVEQGITQL